MKINYWSQKEQSFDENKNRGWKTGGSNICYKLSKISQVRPDAESEYIASRKKYY